MRKLSAILAIGALATTSAIASAQTPLTLQFGPGRDATQPGSVTITPMGNQTRVTIDMTPAGPSQPAHIHVGTCPGVGAVEFPLTNVANGKSETTVNASWDTIQASQHSINVHRSPTESTIYTACVNLPVAQRAAPAAAPAAAARGATQLPRTGGPTLGLLALLGAAFGGLGYGLRRR
ncbi:MAG TPA: hypothetical protein VGL23_04265 [Chloroflexota bacterium]|jgi:hypothetical protein